MNNAFSISVRYEQLATYHRTLVFNNDSDVGVVPNACLCITFVSIQHKTNQISLLLLIINYTMIE